VQQAPSRLFSYCPAQSPSRDFLQGLSQEF
jgi:hypothetical protein